MCYSAQVWADYRTYVRADGADVNFTEFARLLGLRIDGEKIPMPKGLTDAFKFCTPSSPEEAECQRLAIEFDMAQIHHLEEKLFAQRRRLADAERSLACKDTKKAREDKRIATNKVEDLMRKLDDLQRTEHRDRDDRIFPGHFCPVMIRDGTGRLTVMPMRYLCRPAGKPPFYDTRYPGTYNARRDNLLGFWKGQFANTHAVLVATAFFENVKRHRMEGRELASGEEEENVVLKFSPDDGQPMQLACLWSHWTGKEQADLNSFAVITDAPPPEVSAAGHDRCPIPLKAFNVGTWLAPDAAPETYQVLLDDKIRPYYEHRQAA